MGDVCKETKGDISEMEFTLSLKLPEEISQIALVRHVSRDVLGSFGVAAQDVDDIEIVVGELATNAVCHAHDESYMVEVRVTGDTAVVTVSDKGIGFIRENLLPPGTLRTNEPGERIGGWGIPMVVSLTDQVDFYTNEPHGVTVRATKRLQSC